MSTPCSNSSRRTPGLGVPRWKIDFTIRVVLLAAVLASSGSSALAQSARQIMQQVDQQARSTSQQYIGNLEVVDKSGKALRKSWRSWRKGFGGDSRGLVRFSSPPEVKGVGLLVLAHHGAPSDQWLYTPAIQRDRRIAPQDRSV